MVGPHPNNPYELVRSSVWDQYWDAAGYRNFSYDTRDSFVTMDALPREIVGQVLRRPGPVDQSEQLRQGLRHEPLFMLVRVKRGADSSVSLVGWLNLWDRYLEHFPSEAHPNSRLRVVLVPDWAGAAAELDNLSANLRQLAYLEVPGIFEDELATLGRRLLETRLDFRDLGLVEKKYLWLRCLDLAGGSKTDLEAAIEMAAQRKETNPAGWIDDLVWRPDDTWVQTLVQAWLPWLEAPWWESLNGLVERGGMVIGFTPESLRPYLRALWEAGLWVNERGVQHMGWLTPAAVIALKELCGNVSTPLARKIAHLSQALDRIALDLVNRCLIRERLLKQRLLEDVESGNRMQQLEQLLHRPGPNGFSLASEIQRRTNRWDIPVAEMVWELSLGAFLHLREELTGAPVGPWRPLLDTRNALAHGRPSTWAMFCAVDGFDTA